MKCSIEEGWRADGPAESGSEGETADPSAGITNLTTNEEPRGALQEDITTARAKWGSIGCELAFVTTTTAYTRPEAHECS